MVHRADPGRRFESDTHRRVLAHLTTPDEEFGYTAKALFHRLEGDVGTDLKSPDEVHEILFELGDLVEEAAEGVYRMAQKGYDLLTDSTELPSPATKARPVRLDEKTPLRGTFSGGGNGDVS